MPKIFIKKYLKKIQNALDGISRREITDVIEALYDGYQKKRQVFIFGNGGSASSASHFACDLGKETTLFGPARYKIISLNDNISLFTAIANDFGYDDIFKEQLINLLRPRDLVIAISCSGNSPNVIKAIEYAKQKKAKIIGFFGFDGGKGRELADICVTIKTTDKDYGLVESVHSLLFHLIPEYLKEKIKQDYYGD